MGWKKSEMDRRSKRKELPQKGYTQLLQGSRLATARTVNADVHVKHLFEISRAIKHRTAGDAVTFLNNVLKIDSDRPDIRRRQLQYHTVWVLETRSASAQDLQWLDTEKVELGQVVTLLRLAES